MEKVDSHEVVNDSATRPSRRRARGALIAVAVIAAVVGFMLTSGRSKSSKPLTAAQVAATAQAVVDKTLEKAAAAPARSVAVYQSIVPSLVLIRTDEPEGLPADAKAFTTPSTIATLTTPTVPGTPEDSTEAAKKIGIGTGVVINDEGAILTANHIIADAKSIRLTFADGTTTTASVASQEPEKDIAVLMPDEAPSVIVPAVMGGGVQVGDEAYAVGHPFGLTSSLTAGVVSGLDRSVAIDATTTLEGLIQFDAAVNPGNSGGPLLNRNGQVVGIITGLANPAGQGFFVGIGFAVPIGSAGGAAGGPPQ